MAKNEVTETTVEETKKETPKKLLVRVVTEFAKNGVDLVPLLGSDIAGALADFYETLKTSAVRGLPAEERLENVKALIRSHYEAMPAIDSPEHGAWSYDSLKLLQRQQRIEREIAEGGAHPEPKSTRGKK